MKKIVAPRVTEADVQRAIVEGLTALGYVVLVTSRQARRTECPECGKNFHPSHRDGATQGLPDLLVGHREWPTAFWVSLEVKRPDGRLSLEQAALFRARRIAVVRSLDDATWIVGEAERWNGLKGRCRLLPRPKRLSDGIVVRPIAGREEGA